MLKNKRILLALLLALILGGLIGWLIKPSENNQIESAEHQHTETTNEVWTCSMHPQVRLSEPGSCPICGMNLIPATSKNKTADANPLVHEMTPQAVAMANIHTSRVTGVSPEGELYLTGKVKADERQLASITSKFPGRIEQLSVNFTGQMIKSGEKLATIYSPELVTAQKELLESITSKTTYPELYAASREKLRLWKLTENQIDEIEKTGKVSDQFDILANRSGIVAQRNIAVGDYVKTGSTLFEIVDLRQVWIMMDAYESDLPFVKLGDEVSFTAVGIPGQTFVAHVTYIDPVINSSTRAASVRAEVQNNGGHLRPEMFITATVRTTLSKNQSSLVIPRTALLWSGKRSIVYIKVPDADFPTFEMREVTIGPRMGDMWLIEAGLDAGEEIVTNGAFSIDASAQLSGNYSMLMRPKSKTIDVSQTFREQLTTLADAYFEVKNALVLDDAKTAKTALNKMTLSLDKVDGQSIKGEAHDRWTVLQNQLGRAIEMMKDTKDLETLRVHFSMLSESILEVTVVFGLEKDKVYKDFCPMAFGNKGAFWLSETEEILNPYFGEAMLVCGEIKETYLKGQKVFEVGEPANQQKVGGHNH